MASRRLRALSLAGLLLAAVIYVVSVVWLQSAGRDLRWDLTQDRLFTLSAGTLSTLSIIEEPITLHLFYSKRLGREVPFYATYARRVRELLSEIVNAAAGKVRLIVHDPQPFSVAEDRAVAMGVQGIPVVQGADELAYFGLAGINTVDEVEALPFFQPDQENLLEYQVVELIHALSARAPPVVGVISSLPLLGDMMTRMQGGASQQWAVAKHLTTGFEVVNLPQSFDELPSNIKVLVIVHPTRLGPRELFEIEQFLFRGGRALLFLDPKSEAPSAMASAGPGGASSSTRGLARLFDHWGLAIPDGMVVGDQLMAWRINAGTMQQPLLAEYLVWLRVSAEFMAQSDPVTANLPLMNLGSAGFIEVAAASPLAMEPLLETSASSAPVPVAAVAGLQPDVVALQGSFKADQRTYVLAARLRGELTTAFSEGAPSRTIARPTNDQEPLPDRPHLMRSRGPIQLVLVADSDLLQDHMWLSRQSFFGREVERPIASNAVFLSNAVENLAGSDALISLRSRGVSRRPFTRIDELRQRAESTLRQRERELRNKLKVTQDRIDSIEGVQSRIDPTTGAVQVEVQLTDAERREIEGLRQELLAIRSRLRDVRRDLRKDVEELESTVRIANIAGPPALVVIVALLFFALRSLGGRRMSPESAESG